MEKVKQYLATLASQEPEMVSAEAATSTQPPVLGKLEALLNQIEEDAIANQSIPYRDPSVRAADVTKPSEASRRPSFGALERFLDSIDDELGPSTTANISDEIPLGEFTDPDQFALPDNARVTKQIFFDCDNTLVDTEAVAIEACSIVVNKCLAEHNIPHTFKVEELLIDYFGCTAREMIALLADKHKFLVTPDEISAYATYEEDLVIDLIHANPLPCDGVERLLQHLHTQGRYNLSVVSSSPIRRIRAALEAAGIAKYFAEDQVFSAKSSMPIPKSKPDPAVYNFAMAYNKVHSWQCVAFEDSRSGARSAINASIPCIAYLGTYSTPTQQEQVSATLMREGCQEVIKSWSQALGCLERTEKAAAIDVASSLGKGEDLDERRRKCQMLLGQLLLKGSRNAIDSRDISEH